MAALGIILVVVGAILSFAVRDSIAEVDLTMVGYICMAAGAIAIVIGIVQIVSRNRTRHTTRVEGTLPPEEHPRDPRV